MRGLGFSDLWCCLIQKCIWSTSLSIMVIDSIYSSFITSRGIRQGDHLSPLLFILADEGLSWTIRKVESDSLIHGIKIAKDAPTITRLMFAVDTFIFCKANKEELQHLNHILFDLSHLSGLIINFTKSSILPPQNLTSDRMPLLFRVLGLKSMEEGFKYLGFLMFRGKSRVKWFNNLVEKMNSNLNSWSSASNVMTNYLMNFFCVPNSIIRKLEQSQTKFWWGKNFTHFCRLTAWNQICLPKKDGGLDIKSLLHAKLCFSG